MSCHWRPRDQKWKQGWGCQERWRHVQILSSALQPTFLSLTFNLSDLGDLSSWTLLGKVPKSSRDDITCASLTHRSSWQGAQTPGWCRRWGSRRWWSVGPCRWASPCPCEPGTAARCCPGHGGHAPWTWWSPAWAVWARGPCRSIGSLLRSQNHCRVGTPC